MISSGNQILFVSPEISHEEYAVSESEYDIKQAVFPEQWSGSMPFSGNLPETVLLEKQYFVVSDNRSSAHDSRYWGPIDEQAVVSKVILRFWPFNAFGAP